MLKFIDEYRDKGLCMDIAEKIRAISKRKIKIMEVCGGHTMAIRKNGIHKIIGENIKLISGPGCPVCVTSIEDIDSILALSRIKGLVICTFGDIFNVPGTKGATLAKQRAQGADVRIVYSAKDVVEFAGSERDKNFVFISIGFETTAPTAAAAILQAAEEDLNNFYILSLNKTMPQALKAILEDNRADIDGLICPGHVSTIAGIDMYNFIVDKLRIPCSVTGFEPTDILTSIYILTELVEKNQAKLVNAYKRAVRKHGNEKALSIMDRVFKASDTQWRGLGNIPGSGLLLKDEYLRFDVLHTFKVDKVASIPENECICGDILRGAKIPSECRLFRNICTPSNPRGACMVSSEGSCAAAYRYGD